MPVRHDRLFLSLLLCCSVPFVAGMAIATEPPALLVQAQAASKRKAEADRLYEMGVQLLSKARWGTYQAEREDLDRAFTLLQQALSIRKNLGDKLGEADTLIQLGRVHHRLYGIAYDLTTGIEIALGSAKGAETSKFFEAALKIYQQLQHRVGEAEALLNLGEFHHTQYGQAYCARYGNVYRSCLRADSSSGVGDSSDAKAREFYQKALAIYRELGLHAREAETLTKLGATYRLWFAEDIPMLVREAYENQSKDSQRALLFYEQAQSIYQRAGDKVGESETLKSLGDIYSFKVLDYSKSLELYQQSLKVERQVAARHSFVERQSEEVVLRRIGVAYAASGNQERNQQLPPILIYQQELAQRRQLNDRVGTAIVLKVLGWHHSLASEFPQALVAYQQALAIVNSLNVRDVDRNDLHAFEAELLEETGSVYLEAGQYVKALDTLREALANYKALNLYSNVQNILDKVALAAETLRRESGYEQLNTGELRTALSTFQQVLAIQKDIDDRDRQAETIWNIGIVQNELGQHGQALKSLEAALASNSGDYEILRDLGDVYLNLGQYSQALNNYQQVLAILQEYAQRPTRRDPKLEIGQILANIGRAYECLNKDTQALASFEQALKTLPFDADALAGKGRVFSRQGNNSQSVQLFEQALLLYRGSGDRINEARTLNSLGDTHVHQGQTVEALNLYQQALGIARATYSRPTERTALSNIAALLKQQNQPELAIVFYKEAINVTEAIRQDLRQLTREAQESYTTTVASTYRTLANLLLQQDRILEAQQVLDLLKVQELNDYLHNVRGNSHTASGIDNLPPEQQILKQYGELQKTAIQIGTELAALEKLDPSQLTPTQQQHRDQLVQIRQAINKQFNDFIRSDDVKKLVAQLSATAKEQSLSLNALNALRDNLRKLDNAVLLYPLILEDRLELILTTSDSPPIRRTVAVKRAELNQTILDFRKALQNPSSDAHIPAQKLYTWLIKPLEADLKQVNTQTIIYAPDGQLRYIPLAALFDGKQWLVERYRINNITAQSLTDLNTKPQTQPRVLAGAFTTGHYNVTVGSTPFSFDGLPAAGREVALLSATLPNTKALIDRNFGKDASIASMNSYNIVHLATHGAFVIGNPEDSFILFGDGKQASLTEIQDWTLSNVDLVVLSACETGLGGKLGNGEEILGLGYQFQRAGARASIASLWSVNDGGTQVLMNAFYELLKSGNVAKVEALRQAQIALINANNKTVSNGKRSSIEIEALNSGVTPNTVNRLSHPYYWAPFILIGNGL